MLPERSIFKISSNIKNIILSFLCDQNIFVFDHGHCPDVSFKKLNAIFFFIHAGWNQRLCRIKEYITDAKGFICYFFLQNKAHNSLVIRVRPLSLKSSIQDQLFMLYIVSADKALYLHRLSPPSCRCTLGLTCEGLVSPYFSFAEASCKPDIITDPMRLLGSE